jgi:hypothetical protein
MRAGSSRRLADAVVRRPPQRLRRGIAFFLWLPRRRSSRRRPSDHLPRRRALPSRLLRCPTGGRAYGARYWRHVVRVFRSGGAASLPGSRPCAAAPDAGRPAPYRRSIAVGGAGGAVFSGAPVVPRRPGGRPRSAAGGARRSRMRGSAWCSDAVPRSHRRLGLCCAAAALRVRVRGWPAAARRGAV